MPSVSSHYLVITVVSSHFCFTHSNLVKLGPDGVMSSPTVNLERNCLFRANFKHFQLAPLSKQGVLRSVCLWLWGGGEGSEVTWDDWNPVRWSFLQTTEYISGSVKNCFAQCSFPEIRGFFFFIILKAKPLETLQERQFYNLISNPFGFDLVDIWRVRNPECKRFSWLQKSTFIQRR